MRLSASQTGDRYYRYDRRNRTTAKAHITAMNVADLTGNLPHEDDRRHYITRLEILDQSANLLKARLYLSFETFIQMYRSLMPASGRLP